jgi:hypothetical protein
MKESSTYQAILEEGRIEGAIAEVKKMLRVLGDKAFGPPDTQTAVAIERLNDLARLEELFVRMLTVESWQELLGQPALRRRSKRRSQS